MADRAHPNARKAAMEMCAICRGKLGLGTRFRNIYGMAVGGFMFAFVRFVARAFMRSSETAKQARLPRSRQYPELTVIVRGHVIARAHSDHRRGIRCVSARLPRWGLYLFVVQSSHQDF